MKVAIYGLKSPNNEIIEYVGKTTYQRFSSGMRLKEHQNKTKAEKVVIWIEALQRLGTSPEMVLLEKIDDPDNTLWPAREKYWIDHYKERGEARLNTSRGGYDTSHLFSEEQKNSRSRVLKEKWARGEFTRRELTAEEKLEANKKRREPGRLAARKRWAKGTPTGMNMEKARKARKLAAEGEMMKKDIAQMLGIAPQTLQDILKNRTWVEEEETGV